VARGTAAVPMDGAMIDTPVNNSAEATLRLAEACARREGQKAAMRERLAFPITGDASFA